MEFVDLKAVLRQGKGKEYNKRLRAGAVVPAVVYKKGRDAITLQIDNRNLLKALRSGAGENAIIRLHIDGAVKEKERTVMIKEVQRDPVKDNFLHVDFHEISLTEVLHVQVRISAKGEPIGVKQEKGVLQHVLWEVEVECLPASIPEKIEVDISALKIGDAIYVKDIVLPEGVRILEDPEAVVFTVEHAKAVEELVTEPAEGSEKEPEVIREKKEAAAEGEDAPAEKEKEEKKEGGKK